MVKNSPAHKTSNCKCFRFIFNLSVDMSLQGLIFALYVQKKGIFGKWFAKNVQLI